MHSTIFFTIIFALKYAIYNKYEKKKKKHIRRYMRAARQSILSEIQGTGSQAIRHWILASGV